jgi:hypothetical protein
LAVTYDDLDHSLAELQYLAAGPSSTLRLSVVAHAQRAEGIE